jgi:hypothetical protein
VLNGEHSSFRARGDKRHVAFGLNVTWLARRLISFFIASLTALAPAIYAQALPRFLVEQNSQDVDQLQAQGKWSRTKWKWR